MPLPNDIAALIGFACEAVLWGAYSILFGTSLVLLLRRRKGGLLNVPIATASCVLFAACTAHFALEFNHFYITLWHLGVDGFANETKPLVGADILISLCDLFGDFILIYRCWILWGKNYWVIILPTLCAIGGFGCIAEVARFVLALTPSSPVPPASIVPLTTAGYALPLCTNGICTLLIVYKIWRSTRPMLGTDSALPHTSRIARSAAMIIIESGMLYLATQIVFVVLVNIKHPAQAIVAVMAVQIYGIAPTLIIIRVGLGIAVESTHAPLTEPITWARTSEGIVSTDAYSRTVHGSNAVGQSTTKLDNQSLELKSFRSQGSTRHSAV